MTLPHGVTYPPMAVAHDESWVFDEGTRQDESLVAKYLLKLTAAEVDKAMDVTVDHVAPGA